MSEVASAYVSLLPSTKGFGRATEKQVGGEMGRSGKKIGAGFKTAMLAGIAGVGVAATKILGSSISAASDAQQSIGGVEAVFGKYADSVLRDSKRAAQALGLSATAYNELITVSGAMLKNKGLKGFADQSRNLIGIGADLSAMFGGSTKDAVDALNAAMRGESDPIERYGISLNETAVNATLAAKGQSTLTGKALELAKTQARLSLITKQAADSQGAFGRESNTLAGQQQRLNAQWDNMKVSIGSKLLPTLTKLATWFNADGLPALQKFGGFVKDNVTLIGSMTAAIGAGVVAAKAYTLATTVMASIQAAQAVAAGTATTAQLGLNAAMKANMIGLVVTALVGLAAGLVYAYKKSETFRSIVDGAFKAVKKAGSLMWNALKGYFRFIVNAWLTVAGALVHGAAKAFGWVPGVGPKLKGAAKAFDKFRDDVNRSLGGIKDRKVTVRVKADMPKVLTDKGVRQDALFSGRRAAGGPVSARTSYLVGEKGPEIYTPRYAGHITPNHKLTSAGSPLGVGLEGQRLAFVLDDGTQLSGYVARIADRRIGSASAAAGESRRAGDW